MAIAGAPGHKLLLEAFSGSTPAIGTTMPQVAYHVQLTWLLVTAVTPDRLESIRLDAEITAQYMYTTNVLRGNYSEV